MEFHVRDLPADSPRKLFMMGFVQIALSISVNAVVAMTAGSIAGFLARR